MKLNYTVIIGSALITMLFSSCAKNEDRVVVLNDVVTPNVVDPGAKSKLTAITNRRMKEQENDSIQNDSSALDCYRWDSEYYASTKVVNDADNSVYDMNILITLSEGKDNLYTGGMVLYVDEENFVEAYVEGKADGNHITLYYVEDEENTTGDLFKEHDKLVLFELSNGEYAANWYKPMHRFVNESTVISIR